MTWHVDLPYVWFRKRYRRFRSALFAKPRPKGPYYRVGVKFLGEGPQRATEMTVKTIEKNLGGHHSYAPNWEVSYYKRGEVLNLARVIYHDSTDHDVRWWQVHVRGWPVPGIPGAVELTAHWEPEPTEHPRPHLDALGFDRGRGMDILASDLRASGMNYEEVVWPHA